MEINDSINKSLPEDDCGCSDEGDYTCRPIEPSCCGPEAPIFPLNRRAFLRTLGAGSLALMLARQSGAFADSIPPVFNDMVPEDKNLNPDWIKSLFARGEPSTYQGKDSKFIGMPVGGICCGELYLGGDGRLWNWDIFNRVPHTGDAGYLHPKDPATGRSVHQGFYLKINGGGQERIVSLDATGFPDVSFQNNYPIGTIRYASDSFPIETVLEAFSPFIPLNTEDSSLPATVFHFSLKNKTEQPVEVVLAGVLQNAAGQSIKGATRTNQITDFPGFSLINFSLDPTTAPAPLTPNPVPFDATHQADFGTMGLVLLGSSAEHRVASCTQNPFVGSTSDNASSSDPSLAGALGRKLTLAAGETAEIVFVLTWYFPNLVVDHGKNLVGRYYATKFSSAQNVAEYIATNFTRLHTETVLWRDTWYDSTLPFWFLERTLLNISTLSTSTTYRFSDGRFYSYEGVGCCVGTCTHVWHYAHAVARLFPDLERHLREAVDLGIGFNVNTGVIGFRGEYDRGLAVDGQAGTILRFYREHQMSAGNDFLTRLWPQIKKSFDPLFRLDSDRNGILEGAQMNTLDKPWFGKISWLSGMYIAALRAGEQMALEMGDAAFSEQCGQIAEAGTKNIEELFNGEYFANLVDVTKPNTVNSGSGCEIDQVLGQSWAFQVGLPRIFPEKETISALTSLWRYNFSPEVGVWRALNKPGRWYAADKDRGLIMCTFPKPDWDFLKASGNDPKSFGFYFDECMTGFEYQVASHMINEGLVENGLAVTRAIHDRYHPAKRNPYNEVECGDHYSRAMASYGTFLAASGFQYHGPKGHLSFSPRVSPENFRCAFTSAEGWGTYSQQLTTGHQSAEVHLKWGQLKLNSLSIGALKDTITRVTTLVNNRPVTTNCNLKDGKVHISFTEPLILSKDQKFLMEIL